MKKIHTFIIGLLVSINLIGQLPTFQWANKIAPTVTTNSAHVSGVAVDNSGNVYTTGCFIGTTNFGGTNKTASGPPSDFFIAKYNSSGVLVWVNSFGAAANAEIGCDIKVDNNSIYVCGVNGGSNTFDFDPGPGTFTLTMGNGFVAKYDLNGNFQWAKQTGYMGSVDIDKFGNVFSTGIGSSSTAIILEKFNSSGVLMNAINGSGSFDPGRIKVDSIGNVYFIFGFNGTAAFSTFTLTATGSNSDMGVVKLSNSLGHLWSKKIGGAGSDYSPYVIGPFNNMRPPIGICTDNQQNLCLSGMFTQTVNFGPSTFTAGTTGGDGFFGKFDKSNGNTIFVKQLIGSGTGVRCTDIKVDANNYIHINGYFNQTMDADPGPATTSLFVNTGYGMYWCKYDLNGNYVTNGLIGTTSNNDLIIPYGMEFNSSSIYFGGRFYGTEDFDFTTGTFTLNYASTSRTSAFLAKYDYCSAAPASPSSIMGLSSFCPGAGVQTYSVAPVSGATSYTWSLPVAGWSGTSSTNTISATTGTTSGNISVTANNACGSSSAAVLSVTVTPTPTANAGSSQTITCASANVNLGGSGVSTYTWSGPGIVSGGNTSSPVVNMAGTYSLVGSTSGCNSNTATVIVSTNTTAPTLSVTASPNSICTGSSATLTASGASTYNWSTSSTATAIVVSPTTTTNYILTGTNSANGCSNTINTPIGVNPLPTVTANTSNSIICGPPFQGTATLTASGANTYTWNTSATTTAIAVSPGVTTVYTVTGTDANGCVNFTSFTQSVSACTGIDVASTSSATAVSIYPNPTSGIITVKGKEGSQIQVFNSIGELILSTELKNETIELDLSNQSNGIYFIRVGSATNKIIKD